MSVKLEAQTFRTLARLPEKLNESSGIEMHSRATIWSLNDSGGKSRLFLLDTLGKIKHILKIQNARNRDWEDLAKDNQGNIFIGDIGNNNNSAKALCIYKVAGSSKHKSVNAGIISFRYEDQKRFPPAKSKLNFDAEALIWFNNHLYIFTKNRTKPFDGKTYLYRLPDKPGNYVARKIGVFDTGGRGDMTDHWITAADISPSGSKLALLSSAKVWIFYGYKKDDFFSGQHLRIDLPEKTQKEAICFIDEHTLYITDEEWPGDIGRQIYELKLEELEKNNMIQSKSRK
jgi:hypothetical protein